MSRMMKELMELASLENHEGHYQHHWLRARNKLAGDRSTPKLCVTGRKTHEGITLIFLTQVN